MTTQSNPQTSAPVTPAEPDLKASDFFPPGTGWNKAEDSDEKLAEKLAGKCAEEIERDKH